MLCGGVESAKRLSHSHLIIFLLQQCYLIGMTAEITWPFCTDVTTILTGQFYYSASKKETPGSKNCYLLMNFGYIFFHLRVISNKTLSFLPYYKLTQH